MRHIPKELTVQIKFKKKRYIFTCKNNHVMLKSDTSQKNWLLEIKFKKKKIYFHL